MTDKENAVADQLLENIATALRNAFEYDDIFKAVEAYRHFMEACALRTSIK